MKKILTLSLLTASTIIAGLGTLSSKVQKVEADLIEESISNTGDDYAVAFGNGFTAKTIDNGVRIGNLQGTYIGMYKKEKVALDGLSFTFNNVVGTNCKAGGFYFSQKTGHEFTKNVFTLWHNPYGITQSRLSVVTSHDYSESPTCYTTPTFETAGFGIAGSMVMNNNMSTNDGFSILFQKYSLTAWKVTITQLYANTLWQTNANFDEATKSCSVYLKDSDVQSYLDSDGKAYFHVFGIDNSATDAYYEITNMKRTYDPGQQITKDEVKESINSISDEMIESFINKPEIIKTLKESKQKALNSLLTAPDQGLSAEYVEANKFFALWEGRYDLYGYKEKTNEILNDLPFVSYVGNNGVQLTDNKDIQISFDGGYGKRIYSKEIMDAGNFDLGLNLGKLPVYSAMNLCINPTSKPGTYVSEEGKYFFLEFYKTGESTYFIVFGNGTSHNISFEDFGTDKTNSYTGKIINSASGDIKIKVETDFTLGKTILDINNGVIHYELSDNSVLFKGNKATKNTEANFSFGLMNTNDFYPMIITKMFSPDISKKEFIKGTNNELSFFFNANDDISSLKMDGVEVDKTSFNIIDNKKIVLAVSYLNYLSDGEHILEMKTPTVTTTWKLTIQANMDKEEVPWIKKGAIYFKEGQANDEIYPFESYGLDVSKMTFKIDENILDKDAYEFSSYNTSFTLKASFLNTLSKGRHNVFIVVNGTSNIVKLPIIVK